MKNIVFINPSVDKYSEIKLWSSELMDYLSGKTRTVMPKLAPMIFAALTPPEYTFTYIDEEIEDIDFNLKADLVAITAMTIQADRAYEIADEFRKRGAKIIMGGIHVSVLPEEALQHVDSVCLGEGENIWPAMLEDFAAGKLKSRYDAKKYPPVEELVSPRIDIIKHASYSMFPIMASRGCPYNCDFCSIKFSSGNKIRMKPVEQVMAEIQDFEQYNTEPFKKGYQFVDDNLYINVKYTKKLLTALKDQDIFWQGQGTLNAIQDDEMLKLLSECGCRSYAMGFESISEATLKEANKTSNKIEEYEVAARKLIDYGITPAGFFIFGFDSDEVTVFRDTVAFIKEKHILNPYFSVLTPYPGTKVYEKVKDRIFDPKWSHYGAIYSVYKPERMSCEDVTAGTYWASYEIAHMDNIKTQLTYFWEQGPWPTNPTLSFKDRILLMVLALKLLGSKKFRRYASFMAWAATRRKAVDPYAIIAATIFNEMTGKYFKDIGYDPATKR